MSVRLTRNNYQGPQLLRSLQKNDPQVPEVTTSPQRSPEANMNPEKEDAIFALPESSDEEQSPARVVIDEDTPANAKRKRTQEHTSPGDKRTKVETTKATRTSSRMKSTPTSPEFKKQGHTTFGVPEMPDWLSQSSQDMPPGFQVPEDVKSSLESRSQSKMSQSSQNRRKPTYSKKNSYGATIVEGSQARSGIVVPADTAVEDSHVLTESRNKTFVKPQSSPKSARRERHKDLLQLPAIAEGNPEPKAKFSIPDDATHEPESSTASFATNMSKVFDVDELSLIPQRHRRGSTSSLSSLDSIASAQLSQSQKDDLREGREPMQPAPPGFVRCPMCTKLVQQSNSVLRDLTKLTLRQQQDFCHKHRSLDAKSTWKLKGYPEIDWSTLEQNRLPAIVPHLRKVVYRKTESHYFTTLESILKQARGNKKKIRSYLMDGILDVAKQGYYGPKGAKIMAHAIAESLSKPLRLQLKADRAIANVGAAGFISTVLLPEMCQALVMQDMGVETEEEARQIMNESNEVGILLQPDDDHVNREDEA